MKPYRVVIVGGGLTGLTIAHYLEKECGDACRITVLESSDRLGGNIHTVHDRGYLIDAGPDAWISTKPQATELAIELGLQSDIIETNVENRRVYVMDRNGLVPMPDGLVLGIPTSIGSLLMSRILPWDAILRAWLDVWVPAREWRDDDDETIASFLARRLGSEFADRLTAPLLSGIFSGDADALSIMATFPQLVEAEKQYGSLIRAMRAQTALRVRAAADEGPKSTFVTLKNGMSDFVTTLAHKLGTTHVLKNEPVVEIIRREHDVGDLAGDGRASSAGSFLVRTARKEHVADAVVLSAPPHICAKMIRTLDADIASRFDAFIAGSTATVFLAYPKQLVPMDLDASGFIVPRSLGRPMLAATWVSSKWEGRAPSGFVLVRVFIGGPSGPDLSTISDAALVSMASRELWAAMGIIHAPELSHVFRLMHKSPNPMVGHLARMRELKEALGRHGELYLCGNGYDGTGIPDCIRHARTTAENLVRNARQAERL